RAGPQLVTALNKMGLKGTTTADAFQIAQNSLLDLSHAFNSHGQLNKQAMTMVGNYVSALVPMTQNAGALGAAIGAQTIMSQGSVKQLQTVNQSMDSMTSMMEGGASGLSAYSAQVQALPPSSVMAKALTSFTSPAGAAAWQAFASTSTSAPGLITSEEQNLDQIRTALTLTSGTASPFTVKQAQGLTGYELQPALAAARQSPAALAMVMQQMAQEGIGQNLPGGGYYDTGESLAKNYQQAQSAIKGVADSTAQANADTTSMTIKMSQIPAIAKQFSTTVGTTLQSQEAAQAATALSGIQKSALGGGVNKAAIESWVASAKSAGVEGGKTLMQTMDAQLSSMGVSKAMTMKINAVIDPASLKGMTQSVQSEAITAGQAFGKQFTKESAPQFGNALTGAGAAPVVTFKSKVDPPVIPHVGNQIYDINGHVHVPPIPKVPNQTFTITGIVNMVGAGSAAMSGGLGNVRFVGQSGFKVPGTGSGDIVPAMLEPGELVVPKGMVAAGAVDHLRGSIPGFASGGLAGQELPSVLTRASSMINSLGSGGASWSSQQWGQMTSTFLQAAQLSHAMGSATGFQGGGIVPGNSLASIKAQIDAAYTKLDALYAANHNKGDAATSAYWSNVLDPLYAAENRLQGTSSPGSRTSPATFSAAKKAAETGQQILAAFQKTLTGEGAPWAAFGKSILQGLEDGIKGAPSKSLADTLV
ncbi:MAG: hypothetical protein WAL34_16720, partial [Acidobacteriaceae bacterium]